MVTVICAFGPWPGMNSGLAVSGAGLAVCGCCLVASEADLAASGRGAGGVPSGSDRSLLRAGSVVSGVASGAVLDFMPEVALGLAPEVVSEVPGRRPAW